MFLPTTKYNSSWSNSTRQYKFDAFSNIKFLVEFACFQKAGTFAHRKCVYRPQKNGFCCYFEGVRLGATNCFGAKQVLCCIFQRSVCWF